MGRTPDGKVDYKQIGQMVAVVVAILGGGSGTYAAIKSETGIPAALVERVVKLESWRDSHGEAERESRQALAAALERNTSSITMLREAVLTQISAQAITISVVESRVTALEKRQERIR